MSKQLFQDIIPPDRRSIKRIPIPARRGGSSSVSGHSDVKEKNKTAYPSEKPHHIKVHVDTKEIRSHREKPAPLTFPPKVSHPPEVAKDHTELLSYEVGPKAQAPQYKPAYNEHEAAEDMLPPRKTRKKRKSLTKIVSVLVVLALICGSAFWFMSRVSGAEVKITPKSEQVSVDSQFTAEKNAAEGLGFQTVTISKDGKLGIEANGTEYANTKASGVIVIYNTTATAQKLVANTRFQTPDGKIFRISQAIERRAF